MNEETSLHLDRAQDGLGEAELLLREAPGLPQAAEPIMRCSMPPRRRFSITASSVTRTKGSYRLPGRCFAKTGVIDARFHKYLKESFDLRQKSDDQPVVRLTDQQAQEVLDWAREFVATCRRPCE